MTVINLQDHLPHLEGEALCLECRHSWEATAPVGTTRLDCPECGLLKGVWRNICQTEAELWHCNCGNDTFLIHRDRILCGQCGGAQYGMFD